MLSDQDVRAIEMERLQKAATEALERAAIAKQKEQSG